MRNTPFFDQIKFMHKPRFKKITENYFIQIIFMKFIFMILSFTSVMEQSLSKFYKELNIQFRNYTLKHKRLVEMLAFNFHFSSLLHT